MVIPVFKRRYCTAGRQNSGKEFTAQLNKKKKKKEKKSKKRDAKAPNALHYQE